MVGKRVRLTSTQRSQPLSMCITVLENGVVPLLSTYHLYYLFTPNRFGARAQAKPSLPQLSSPAQPGQARFVGAWKCGTWKAGTSESKESQKNTHSQNQSWPCIHCSNSLVTNSFLATSRLIVARAAFWLPGFPDSGPSSSYIWQGW